MTSPDGPKQPARPSPSVVRPSPARRIGDSTDDLSARLDRDAAPPPAQVRLETTERLPLPDFPIPAYGLIPLGRYLIGSIQFSSGCPYRCDFCVDAAEPFDRAAA